jgi:hypothetical protein
LHHTHTYPPDRWKSKHPPARPQGRYLFPMENISDATETMDGMLSSTGRSL